MVFIEKFFASVGMIYGLFWIILIIVCVFIILPIVILDRIKNKEDDYYSKKVKK